MSAINPATGTGTLVASSFGGPVLRDGWTPINYSSNDTALAVRSFMSVADFNTLKLASENTTATSRTGLVLMGGADALQISLLSLDGDDGETYNCLVTALNPVYDVGGSNTIVGFMETFVASYTWTLGTLALGAVRPTITGLASDDLWADTVVANSTAGTAGFVTHSPADNTIAYAIVPADQQYALLVRLDAGTATAASEFGIVMARRLQGAAQRS